MAHLQIIEDDQEQMIDLIVYCSDYCHSHHPLYDGWHGCMEISWTTPCSQCGVSVPGLDED